MKPEHNKPETYTSLKYGERFRVFDTDKRAERRPLAPKKTFLEGLLEHGRRMKKAFGSQTRRGRERYGAGKF